MKTTFILLLSSWVLSNITALTVSIIVSVSKNVNWICSSDLIYHSYFMDSAGRGHPCESWKTHESIGTDIRLFRGTNGETSLQRTSPSRRSSFLTGQAHSSVRRSTGRDVKSSEWCGTYLGKCGCIILESYEDSFFNSFCRFVNPHHI